MIFGAIVPWDRFWRTVADAATKITFGKSLWFGGKELPAGEYSIFTMPSPRGGGKIEISWDTWKAVVPFKTSGS